MKQVFTKDLMKKGIKDLIKLRTDLKKELANLRMKLQLKSLKQTHLINIAKTQVARINTVLSSKLKNNGGDMK